ncbi:hypothetical protein [Microbacterium sp.]|uniref:hypothetical protein n=1 Tax=Microbacterium sp. TaxID=51671 RepID=UPI003F9C4E75
MSSTTWLPIVEPFGTDHVNVTSPLSSATEVPMSNFSEYCAAETDSPGSKPWPWATCVSPTWRRSFSSSIEIFWPSAALDAFAFEADSLSEEELESLSEEDVASSSDEALAEADASLSDEDVALSSDEALAEADASLSDEAAASEEASDDESAFDAAADAALAFEFAAEVASAFDVDEASA